GVQREVVTALLGVRLVALEVVDRGSHGLSGALAGACGVDRVSDVLQRLEWHHDLIVFDEVANDHQDLSRHRAPPKCGTCAPSRCLDLSRSACGDKAYVSDMVCEGFARVW